MTKATVELRGFEPDRMATHIASLFTQWNNDKQIWIKRVREVIQYIYATSTRETSNVKNPWSHSTVVPKLTQIHDNLGSNYVNAMVGNREFFDFEPATVDDNTIGKRKAIVAYLATKHDYNGFKAVMQKLLQDWVQTGNCFCRVEYVVEQDTYNGLPVITYQGPKVVRISPYDIVFDPTIAEFKDSPKIIRSLITRGELKRRSEQVVGRYYDQEIVQKVMDFSSLVAAMKDVDVNKIIQMNMDGFASSSDYFRSGKVELLDFVGDVYDPQSQQFYNNSLITIVDRRWLLQVIPLEDYQGYGKIYHSGWRKRPDNLWAQGPLDNLVGMQYLINHLENARADGFDQMLSPDRVHVGNVEIEKDGPVTNYYIDDRGGSVQNLSPDGTVLNADSQIQIKEAQMEAYAGAPREAMGIRTPGEKTAFEVESLQTAAGRLFQTKIEDFEMEIIEPVLNGELEVSVLNLDVVDVARVIDKDYGVDMFLSITREDISVKGKLRARGASHFSRRSRMVRELSSFQNVLAGDQKLAAHFPAKVRAKAWSDALSFGQYDMYVPFGQVAEDLEGQQLATAAQGEADQFAAAAQGDAQSSLQGLSEAGGSQ